MAMKREKLGQEGKYKGAIGDQACLEGRMLRAEAAAGSLHILGWRDQGSFHSGGGQMGKMKDTGKKANPGGPWAWSKDISRKDIK